MSIEAMKQALEALEDIKDDCSGCEFEWSNDYPLQAKAFKAIRQAIAEAEKQEPDKYVMDIECTKCGAQQSGILTVNTTPQPKQERGEPVAWQERQAKRMKDGVVTEWSSWYPCLYRTIDQARTLVPDHIPYEWRPLYTHPQQRTWVGLTDEDDINWDGTGNLKQLVEAVEAKLKDKNL